MIKQSVKRVLRTVLVRTELAKRLGFALPEESKIHEYHAKRIREAESHGISIAEAFERETGSSVSQTLDDYVFSICGDPQSKTVLDFGAGIGVHVPALAKRFQRVLVAEINSAYVNHLRKYFGSLKNVVFHQLPSRGWPIPVADDCVDFIFAKSVFNIVPGEGVIRILMDFVRILKPGGTIVADFNDITHLHGEAFRENLGRSAMTLSLIRQVADEIGLSVIRVKTDDENYTHSSDPSYVQVAFSLRDGDVLAGTDREGATP